ncbi:unnamed protein product [Amoebophrya sp. A25]|nr:unnamed protein product [Amoebophrya sp. A25]|eukprot:GSA25T00023652001.1
MAGTEASIDNLLALYRSHYSEDLSRCAAAIEISTIRGISEAPDNGREGNVPSSFESALSGTATSSSYSGSRQRLQSRDEIMELFGKLNRERRVRGSLEESLQRSEESLRSIETENATLEAQLASLEEDVEHRLHGRNEMLAAVYDAERRRAMSARDVLLGMNLGQGATYQPLFASSRAAASSGSGSRVMRYQPLFASKNGNNARADGKQEQKNGGIREANTRAGPVLGSNTSSTVAGTRERSAKTEAEDALDRKLRELFDKNMKDRPQLVEYATSLWREVQQGLVHR